MRRPWGRERATGVKRVEVVGPGVPWGQQLGVWKSLWLLPAALEEKL